MNGIIQTGFQPDAKDINFYDDEIITVAESAGLFGLQP